MPGGRNYSSVAVPTTLAAAINNSQTGITLTTPITGWPAVPFLAAIERNTANEEVVNVIAFNAAIGTATVERGYDGTTAVAHDISKPIEHVTSAADFRDIQTDLDAFASRALWVPGTRFITHAGTPVDGNVNTIPGKLMDPATQEAVQGNAAMPVAWQTADVFLWWIPINANAGNVRWQILTGRLGLGLGGGSTTQPAVTGIAPSAIQAQRTQVVTALSVGDFGTNFRVLRVAADASDTYASDVLFIGLELVRVS